MILRILLISLWTSFRSFSPSRAVLPAWTDYRERGLPRRFWLMKLALSATGGAWLFLLISAIIFQLSMMNVFIAVSREGMGATPDAWIFWTASGAWTTVATLGILSFVVGAALGRHFLLSTLAWVLIFPSFLSLPGFVAVAFGERLGARLWLLLRDPTKRRSREWQHSFLLQSLAFLITLLLSPVMYAFVREALPELNPFHPHFRFALGALALVTGIVVQLVLEMTFFHFYFRAVTRSAGPTVTRSAGPTVIR